MRTIAIPAHNLGALEQAFKQLDTFKLKRERQSEFQRICRVLKDLRLIDPKERILGVSLGVDKAGELTAFVSCELLERHVGQEVPR